MVFITVLAVFNTALNKLQPDVVGLYTFLQRINRFTGCFAAKLQMAGFFKIGEIKRNIGEISLQEQGLANVKIPQKTYISFI